MSTFFFQNIRMSDEYSPNNETFDESKKPRGCFRPSCLLLFFCGLIFLAGFYLLCFYVPPLHISEETTRITGPLTPDGQIDFFKAIEELNYPPELATDDNGYRLFIQKFGDVASEVEFSRNPDKDFYTKQKAEKLGLDPATLPKPNFLVEPQSGILKSDHEKIGKIVKPWTLDDLPELADWIKEVEEPLNQTAEMLRKPVFKYPYLEINESRNLYHLLLPDAQYSRAIARQFQARANYRIAAGDVDGAIEDNISLYHLARKTGQGGVLVEMLVSIAIEGVASAISIAGNPEHQPAKEQLQKLRTEIDELPSLASWKHCLENERLMSLSAIQSFFLRDKVGDGVTDQLRWTAPFFDPNIFYRETNIAYDMLTGKLPKDGYEKFIERPDINFMTPLHLLTVPSRSKFGARIFRALYMPAHEAAEEAYRRNHCCTNLKRLQLALLMYKNEHGDFPDADWIEKIKPYLGDDPDRYFRCPSNQRTMPGSHYALVLYDQPPKKLDSFLLVELMEAQPYEDATVSVEQVLRGIGSNRNHRLVGSFHHGGANVAKRNGSVVFISETTADKELKRLVGIEVPEEETFE